MTADGGFPLYQRHLFAGVREGQRGVYAGYPAAHYQHVGVYRYSLFLERLVEMHAGHGGADQVLGLLRGGFLVGVHPGGVLAYVHHLEEERVKPALGRRLAEGFLVQVRRAGRHYQAVQLVLLYILGYHLLAGVGAHIFVIARNDHPGQPGDVFLHIDYVYDARYIRAAVADIEPDAGLIFLFRFVV